MTTTVIRNADWVVAWDEVAGRHVYRRNIDIAFADDTIVFVGPNYPAAADRVIEGRDRLILPGLIDIHSHPEHEPLYRGVREEHGLRNMHMTGLTNAHRHSQHLTMKREPPVPNSPIVNCC